MSNDLFQKMKVDSQEWPNFILKNQTEQNKAQACQKSFTITHRTHINPFFLELRKIYHML